MLMTKLKQEQKDFKLRIAKDYVNKIYDIIEVIAKTGKLDYSIETAYDKLQSLKKILNDDY